MRPFMVITKENTWQYRFKDLQPAYIKDEEDSQAEKKPKSSEYIFSEVNCRM